MATQIVLLAPSKVLPSYLTTFIGREDDLALVVAHLNEPAHRLTTVTGPAGVGKTRLMVEAVSVRATARESLPADWVFVDGAAIERAADLLPSIALALGIEQPGTNSAESISEFLADRETLLLLDNLEHLSGGLAGIGGLLRACPGLRVLATSRMPLRLSGEKLLALEPLPLAAREHEDWSPAALLFLDRARMADRSFDANDCNPATVELIVRQIDGIPLAIELAAARLRILSTEALAALLSRQLTVLTDGPSDAAARHRTLQEAIDWSYRLLDPARQQVMRCLGIFPETFSLDAVEAVCFPNIEPVNRRREALAIVSELYDQGLLQRTPDVQAPSPRFRMLTSIREFARDRLLESGHYQVTSSAFLDYFVTLVEREEARLIGSDPSSAMARLSLEMANIRQIFTVAIERDDPSPALRAIGALWRYWEVRGPLQEARHLIAHTFDSFGVTTSVEWGSALRAGGIVAELVADWEHALAWNRRAIEVWTALGDQAKLARSLIDLGNVESATGLLDAAAQNYERALELARIAGDRRTELIALSSTGNVALRAGDIARAAERFETALPAFRAHRDPVLLGIHLANYGVALGWLGKRAEAIEIQEESLRIRREIGDEIGIANSLINLEDAGGRSAFGGPYAKEALAIGRRLSSSEIVGTACTHLAIGALERKDIPASAAWLIEALPLSVDNPPPFGTEAVATAADVAAANATHEAAQLLGAAQQLRAELDIPWEGQYSEQILDLEQSIRSHLGDAAFASARERGRKLDQQQAILLALAVMRQLQRGAAPPFAEFEPPDARLTPRELMVLRLLAAGRTDREIADELFISRKTASHHVTNILAKLECRNRAGAIAVAFRLGLAVVPPSG